MRCDTVSRVPRPPLRVLRLANPVVRAVLESPFHRALSRTLLTLAYRGRSGRSFRIPVRYAETTDGAIVALAVHPERKLWWRSFAAPSEATLTLRGDRVEATGALAAGDDRERALQAYVARFPRSADLARDAAIVVFIGNR
jgi:hypothetical protein